MATDQSSGGDTRVDIDATGTPANPAHQSSFRPWYAERWPFAVLIVMIVLTGVAYTSDVRQQREIVQRRFDNRAAEIEQAITDRMDAYTEVLRGGLGLFYASDKVRREEWRRYIATLSVDEVWPGIQGIGYAEFVRPEERAAYEQSIRAEGFPDFAIKPPGPREIYSSITFLEPFDERNRQAFGFDMYQQETRRAAMNLARDTGQVAVSGRVTLVQEITDDVQAGFLMYLPFFDADPLPEDVAARRSSIAGFVYSPFRVGNLMAGILGKGLPDVRLEIFDQGELDADRLMYDSASPDERRHRSIFQHEMALDVGNRQWTMRVTSLPNLERAEGRIEEFLILGGGLALSFLVFGVLWSFATTRSRAQALANNMTLKLQESTEDLKRSNAELELFAYVASHDLKAPLRGIDHLASWIESDLGDALTGEPKQNMALMKGRIKRLEALLDDLLAYSRAGRADENAEPFTVEETARDLFDSVNSEGRFKLHQEIGIKVLKFPGLDQILLNLFANTIKHHGEETGNAYLKVIGTAQHLEIHYEDDGVGIPADQRERAFQMFQTLQPRDKVEGSGMGMAIIRKLVERHGGTVTCEDRPNGRSGVFFRIRWKRA